MKKAFKAYDIRGVYGKDFNATDVYKIGYFLPSLLDAKRLLIGMDTRLSSPEIFENLSNGIIDAGADVDFCGLVTTPMVYWATAKFNFKASVMITASHNPPSHNGLKISRSNAIPVGYESGLSELLHMAETIETIPVKKRGTINRFDMRADYLAFLIPYVSDLSSMKIAIDCSNGMGSVLATELFGKTPLYLFDTLDGTFPNHEPNPLEAKNIVHLSKTVVENHCDVGIIFDGDADRVMFVDEKGKFIQPDMMIAILAGYYNSIGKTGKCLQDIRTSKSVTQHVESLGFEMHIWRVGRAYAALKLREIDGLFGGELAGHYYFRDFYYSDSAYLAALILLKEIKKIRDEQGLTLSQIISKISVYEGSGEINLTINDKEIAIKTLLEEMNKLEKPIKVLDFDGFRVEYKHWWFNVRPSNTEPYLRLILEADSNELLTEKQSLALTILEPFIVKSKNKHD